jgi:AmiR/NasT family two-component response regulator
MSLEARQIIKVAQEILLAADHRLTLGEAFRVLRQAAESSDTALRRVAEDVIEQGSGSTPGPRETAAHATRTSRAGGPM